jgi:predicted HTH domain antitoxin
LGTRINVDAALIPSICDNRRQPGACQRAGNGGVSMTRTITVEIPEPLLGDLGVDQASVVQEVIELGVHQYKIRQALRLYQAGAGSLGYVAEQAGLSKRDLIREARARGIEPEFDELTVREELGA